MNRFGVVAIFFLMINAGPAAAADSLFFSTLSLRDGLPSNIVSAVAQDNNDFIWIGTANGLCRYDGHRFLTFKKEESHQSLPSNEISALAVDGEFLWVGTWKGLCKINTRTFEITPVNLENNNVIRALWREPDGVMWIGTTTGLIRHSDKGLEEYNTQNTNISHNTIRCIYRDQYNNLWVGTYDKLNRLKAGTGTFEVFDLKGSNKPELKNNLIMDVKPDKQSDSLLWVGTETGLCHLNMFTGKFTRYNEMNMRFSNEVIKNIYADNQGNLWLGTDFGLNIFNPAKRVNHVLFHNPQIPYSIANNAIWEISEDSGGVIWFVTSNGLSRLNKFRNYYSYHEVSHDASGQRIGNLVKSMLVTKKGIMWLATLHGVVRMDPSTNKKEIFDTECDIRQRVLMNNVYALEEDDYGRIWIGTAGGINIWDEQRKKMYSITSNPTNGLITNYIAKFTKGTDGSFWVSAWEGGLFKVTGNFADPLSFRFELVGDFGSEKNVSGSNAIWAVNYNELSRIDLNTHRITQVRAFNKLSAQKSVHSLYFSRKGSFWASTLNGLIEYRPQSDTALIYPVVTGNDVLLTSITEDTEGNIWGAGNGFILKFDISDHNSELFPLDKDIPLKSFYNGCVAVNKTGDLLFGGDNGYISISPQIRQNVYKPKISITSLEVNNEKVTPTPAEADGLLTSDIAFTKSIDLAYNQRSIAVEFSSLHYWQPSMNIYAYKLEGFDKKWNYVSGTKNFAVYSNLSPGEYILQVKGTNNYGVWSDDMASLQLQVSPPLFLSRGFLLVYGLLAIIIIYSALRFYSARLHLRNEVKIIRMEKAHAEEIALTKQQFFTNISHELRTPISLILPPIQQALKRENLDEENRSLIKLAEKNSYRLLRVVNQILDFRKLEHDSLELKITCFDLISFCRDLYSLFSDKAARNQIHFTFNPTLESCKIWADTDKVETVLYNLLSNAFKFTSNGGAIDLTIRLREPDKEFSRGSVDIIVSDTGTGILPEDQPKIFERFYQAAKARTVEAGSGIGLTLVAEYAKLHHGKVAVQSTPGKGSCFTVTFPLGHIHFPVDSTRETEPINFVVTKEEDTEQPSRSYLYDLDSDKPLIMIVEDNADMIEFLRINLKNKYHLIIAENGEAALPKANSFLPEIIISDIMMPVMDGLTLCKKIKENPKTSHIGIILLTAKNLTAQKVEGIRMGADAYLTKPFEMELLDANIDHLLKRKQELVDYLKSEIITQPENHSRKENVDDKFVRKVMNIIEANISNPDFGVEMLGSEIGMSATHLYRKLKSLTHLSANEIIRKYRIKKASLLLKNKEGNISEIMYDVGFSSLSYFSKCFKAEFGMSPKDYQQKMSKGTVDIGKDLDLDFRHE